ncbi:MFS transporter [Paractinoplanes lichenicola]|uniref:MFS transporter n=1 Tax=Paractinoplanes lichenicola TaxID=2802976 RepID=A0ABS1VJF5_9ACTN|nr:MFS transporter [Actinoplanes lichenicola]MBL7254294.1 MFS transporter [Actinoplanes lichenicola]
MIDTRIDRRWAVTAVFFLNGLTLSTYIVRAPSFKAAHDMSDALFGLSGLLFALSALACMQAVGPLAAKIGTRTILRLALAVMPLLLAGLAVAPGPQWYLAGAAVLGGVHGATDAAMNASAVAVEREAGRPILNGCHAAWSISAVIASLSTAALAHFGVSLAVHLCTAAAVLLFAGIVTARWLPDNGRAETEPDAPVSVRAGWSRPLILLGLTATALMICEGAALGWGGIFLYEERNASLSLAAVGITAYTGAQALGRLAGDRLSGRPGLFRTAALIAAAGFAVAVLIPHPGVAVAGFAVAGLGSSVLVPLTFSAVGRLPGASTAALVSRLTTFTYTGILLGPALIGWVAGRIGLATTMIVVIPLLLLVVLVPRPKQ